MIAEKALKLGRPNFVHMMDDLGGALTVVNITGLKIYGRGLCCLSAVRRSVLIGYTKCLHPDEKSSVVEVFKDSLIEPV